MLKFPATLDPDTFLNRHWQKQPLFLPQALPESLPVLSADELGWLATQDDVESRLVVTRRDNGQTTYEVENGPFAATELEALGDRDWTLLVHDVEKHLPAMRQWFDCVPFIPDWRIDDLMISFAAPGGSVGPHQDNYDVFLCQADGSRNWNVTQDDVPPDPEASQTLALLAPFSDQDTLCRRGDVLYLPPTVPHWGIADSACMTYSIGMRAPSAADLLAPAAEPAQSVFYADTDLQAAEARPGYISAQAIDRSLALFTHSVSHSDAAQRLGIAVTQCKDWLKPDPPDERERAGLLQRALAGEPLELHGMARLAWDDKRVYLNGNCRNRPPGSSGLLQSICASRRLQAAPNRLENFTALLRWLAEFGAFDVSDPC